MFAILCCACRHILQEDGSKLLWNPLIAQPAAATRSSKEAADSFARSHGWQTDANGEPGNHRCSECRDQFNPSRGAYLLFT